MQKLGDAPIGQQIALYRDKFIVLDHLEQGVLVIRAHNWRKSVFDGHTNNLRDACIRTALDEYWQILRAAGAELRTASPDGSSLRPVRKTNIDLTAAIRPTLVLDPQLGYLRASQTRKEEPVRTGLG